MYRRFDLVVFDIGGVLVQAVGSWTEAHARAGLQFPPPSGARLEERLARLPKRNIGSVDSERYYTLFAEASEGVYSISDVRRIDDASLIGEYQGVGRVFDALAVVSIDTALLSNSNDAHWARLFAAAPGEPEFPALLRARHRFGSHLLGVLKPDPRAYRHVEDVTGHSGDRILYFDDVLEYVEAARNVGWTAEVIDHTADTAAQIMAFLRQHGLVS